MIRSLSVIGFCVLALSVSGCGKSYPKLTQAQKDTVKKDLKSFSQSLSSLRSGGSQGLGAQFNLTASDIQTRCNLVKGPNLTLNGVDLTESGLNSSFGIASPSYSRSSSTDGIPASMDITGTNCPFEAGYNVTIIDFQGGGSHITALGAKITGQFNIKDAALKRSSDIDSGNASIEFNVSARDTSGSLKLNATATLHSQTQGDIHIAAIVKFNASQSGGSASAELKLDYAGFQAVIEAKADSHGGSSFSLNGEEISEQEMRTLLPFLF